MRKFVFLFAGSLLLAGCGDPKLDGSSEEAMKKSVQKISESLSSEKKAQFESGLELVIISNVDFKSVLNGDKSAADLTGAMLSDLNGKTAEQVIATADLIRIERERKEREQAVLEIEELKKKEISSEKAKQELQNFSVSKSRFYLEEEEYSFRPKPVIAITVKNGTQSAVSRAYFKGTVSSPGRSIPWIVEDFNYEIRGGLEPGEQQSWNLLPNQFGEWGKVNPPKDAVFTVEVVRLDGADKNALFDSDGLSVSEKARLEHLTKKYQ
ncbi:DUF6694 family lipoprotein [Pseudomonas sp. TMW22080]|uniref:DUF6694 family lipoprotein n=1 Tax=Pseudomonas sp. TMW22080 TaxID=2506432 RepID=UPI001F105E6F|nr:DUF6694 family lipoprotein [Pseudomonas sp. TMW22080]MCH4885539.1 hypothetical protein [Pseudomonas sp. TMW22080]